MSWNTTILLAEGKSHAEMARVVPDVFIPTSRTIDWHHATSPALDRYVAVGAAPGWGVIATPDIDVTTSPEVLAAASRGSRALSIVLGGVSSIYGFDLYADGRSVRHLFRECGEIVAEGGIPLPEELEVEWVYDEDALFDLTHRITGLDLKDSATWGKAQFTVMSLGL